MDSMTMEDFDELVFERTPKGTTLIIDLGGVRKDVSYKLLLRQRTSWTGWLLFTSLWTQKISKNTRNILVDDDFDETSM
jgi:hypothetical protein